MNRVAIVAFLGLLMAAEPVRAALQFDLIATDGVGGVGFIDAGVRPALADDGTVVLVGSQGGVGPDQLWAGDGASLASISLAANQMDSVLSVAVRSTGDIALIAKRKSGSDEYQGVYTTTTTGAPIATQAESLLGFFATEGPPRPNVAMSENGNIAFSTLSSSFNAGSVWRSTIGGAPVALRNWSGVYFNTQVVDVNNAGQVPVQMEYGDPTKGLSRGILIFENPGDTLDTIDSAIEKTSVGEQPMPSINSHGRVAFALNSSPVLRFYTVPNDATSAVLTEMTLSPGIWLSEPTPFGSPLNLVQLVDTSTGYSQFGNVEINDAGLIAFEADFAGERGVFLGPDPISDRVLLTGDPISPGSSRVWSIVKLGEINDAQQLTLLTSQFGGDQQVWRVAVPEPSTLSLLFIALPWCCRRRR